MPCFARSAVTSRPFTGNPVIGSPIIGSPVIGSPVIGSPIALSGEPDWDFFLPDEDDPHPEPGDFWLEPDDMDDRLAGGIR